MLAKIAFRGVIALSAVASMLAAAPALAAPSTGPAPNVVGRQVLDAEQILKAWAAEVLITREAIGTPPTHADLGYGIVEKQGDSVAASLPPTITLYVVGQVPDLVGKTRAGAEQLLTLYGMGSTWQPASAAATWVVRTQTPPPGTRDRWSAPVAVVLGPPPSQSPSKVRVPQFINLSVKDARSTAEHARLKLDLHPPSASDSDVIADQSPLAGQLVSVGTLVVVEAKPGAGSPSGERTGPTTGGTDAGQDHHTLFSVASVTLISAGAILFLLVALLALYALLVRGPKGAAWVRAHVRARLVTNAAGEPTIRRLGVAGDLSVRIRPYIDPGSHAFEETSR